MPELPEVETIRTSLAALVAGASIMSIERLFPGILIEKSETYVLPFRIEKLRRRGKYLLIDLTDHNQNPFILIVHLRMTGKLLLHDADVPPPAHTHVRFAVGTSGKTAYLDYVDVRRFGRIWLFPGHDEHVHPTIRALGPEPLGEWFTPERLWQSIKRHPNQAVKATLLTQTEIAGLGNIYADEALFLAGLRPTRKGKHVRKYEAVRLHQAIRDVLALGIGHRGTSFRDYVNSLGQQGSFQQLLHVYGRSGQPCHTCGQTLETTRVAGRTTRYCRHCQR